MFNGFKLIAKNVCFYLDNVEVAYLKTISKEDLYTFYKVSSIDRVVTMASSIILGITSPLQYITLEQFTIMSSFRIKCHNP